MAPDRRLPRTVLDRILCIQMESANHAIVLNVSDDGLGFHAVFPVTDSGTIRFSFRQPNGQRIEASGDLVWTDSTKKTGGLRFASLPGTSREQVRTWLAQATAAASTGTASEPANPQSKESLLSGGGPPQANNAPTSYGPPAGPALPQPATVPLPQPVGVPLPQPTSPGFVLFEDDPQSTRYPSGQEMSFSDPPTKFFRGFVVGAITSAILAAILFFAFGNPTGVLLTLRGASPVPEAATTALPPVAVPPPPVSSGLTSSDSTEAAAAFARLPDSADDSKAKGAPAQTATEPPFTGDHVTRAPGTLKPKAADPGGADLALAHRYLDDKTGPGASAAAAHFLWAAVSKGNVTAEITLADLYARGDGVTKSCDQARALLRAAAGKGGSEASQELAQIIRRSCH